MHQEDNTVLPSSITLVVRCFNEERHIGRLLTGVMRQTVVPDQIVIVDSGSTDATLSIASRFPVEILSLQPSDFSFGRSLNEGCRRARGEVIAVASAHVFPVYDSWLAELVGPFVDPAVALAYGRQVGDGTTRYSERQILRRWFPERSERRQMHPFCNNANAAIRRSVWEAMPYDEELTGLEDMAWANGAIARGHHLAYVAEAPVVHRHRERWSQVVNRYRREAIAHRRILHDQRVGALEAVRLAVANIASDYIHAVRDRELLANLVSIPWFRSAQFLGTYQGFAQRGEVSAVLRRRFYYPNDVRHRASVDAGASSIGRAIHYDEVASDSTTRRPS